MSGFEVTPYALDGAAAFVGETGAALRSGLVALAADIAELRGASWTGAAASGFGRGWDEWEAGAREVIGALETMAALLRGSAADYRDAEWASVLAS